MLIFDVFGAIRRRKSGIAGDIFDGKRQIFFMWVHVHSKRPTNDKNDVSTKYV